MSARSRSDWQPKYAWRELERIDPPKRSAANRIHDFQQTIEPYDEATAREQASRCVQCPTPNCVEACPLETPIVGLLERTADGQFAEAAELLFTTCHLPELASHVCVGGRLCENACVVGGKADPVPIRAILRFLLDYGWKHGLAEPPVAPATGQRVAVIGSGICGMVAADALSRRGYRVTVIDSREKPGGRMMNGLPGFRVDTELVGHRVELLRRRGIQFRMGVVCGRDVHLGKLRDEFDAVFLGFSRADAVPLEVPGAGLRGVHFAHELLMQNVENPADGTIQVHRKRVVVLGGGDTAMDALRTAIRCGAAETLCVCRRDEKNLAADAEEYANAVEEGARFQFLSQTVAVIGNAAGDVTGVKCVRTVLGERDASGRLSVTPVSDSEFEAAADVVLVAYGFTAPKLPRNGNFGELTVDARGALIVNAEQMTNLEGVFGGGSIVRGSAPLADVVLDARKAAESIDRYLTARRK